ncbi:polyprenyl synthetase family protein [Eubacteriales bacterium OttesenSCG-928-K08]|nr:polyprenyl synthetase family protein [Eubacteriales bacterium OttesenSCG-928-K08]
MIYLEQQTQYIQHITNALEGYLNDETIPALQAESMRYSLFAGGKRLRPCLTLASCQMLGGTLEQALPFACALEMIHTYSLIHDDLPAMDNDDLRRGRPTNHKVYGEAQAILAGDGLLSIAFEVMLSEAVENGQEAVRAASAVARGAGVRGMVAGQCLDIQNEGKHEPDEKMLHNIHRGKTAALIIAAVEAGGLCAGANAAELKALQTFGEQYGLLFQITDDLLDVIGEEENMGKTLGKDAKTGKLTFPAVYGLEGAQLRAKQAAKAALLALEPFGVKAWYLKELVNSTISRRS